MEVQLSPEIEQKLKNLATRQGRDAGSLATEAIERLVDYDVWFQRQVQVGLEAAEQGEFLEDDEVTRLIDQRYPG